MQTDEGGIYSSAATFEELNLSPDLLKVGHPGCWAAAVSGELAGMSGQVRAWLCLRRDCDNLVQLAGPENLLCAGPVRRDEV
jgi:hypothetical protein